MGSEKGTPGDNMEEDAIAVVGPKSWRNTLALLGPLPALVGVVKTLGRPVEATAIELGDAFENVLNRCGCG